MHTSAWACTSREVVGQPVQAQYKSDAAQYAQLQGNPPKTDLTVIQPPVAEPGAAPLAGASGTSGAASATTPASTPTAATATSASHSKIPQGRVARGLLGGAVGLLVGLALALILDRFDTRLYRPAEMEDAFGLPLLAELRSGDAEEPVVAVAPLSEASERYRMLQASLAADWAADAGAQVVLVAPLHTAGGGSIVAANLAVAFRDAGHAVAVVTAEPFGRLVGTLGRSGVARQAEPQRSGGLSVVRDLQVLTADGDSPGARTSQMIDLMDAAKTTADAVIVDTAPLLIAHDATRLAPRSDAIVLVAVAGRERTADAARAGSLLRAVDGPAVGLVLLKTGRRSDATKPARARSQGRHTRAGSRSSPTGVVRAPATPAAADGVAGVNGATTPYTNGVPAAVVVESGGAGEPEGPPS